MNIQTTHSQILLCYLHCKGNQKGRLCLEKPWFGIVVFFDIVRKLQKDLFWPDKQFTLTFPHYDDPKTL